jgi:D-amino-acid oxidase
VLQGLAALSAVPVAAARPATKVLPSPDFTLLRERSPYVVGVRPFRAGGVRLELEAVQRKQVVHNYGHGGAGITLAFGCAEEAADLVDEVFASNADGPGPVAVVGTGVVGLTTALAVRRRHPTVRITIYAKNLDLQTTTSSVAAGQFAPSGLGQAYAQPEARARLDRWLSASKARIQELRPRWEHHGIAARNHYALPSRVGMPSASQEPHTVVALPFERLNRTGRLHHTWLLDPSRLLPALKAELEARDVQFRRRELTIRSDLASLDEDVLANCTGYGARALFGDASLVGQRGHLARLERPSTSHDYLFASACGTTPCQVFCRFDDIVVGGTLIGGDDRSGVLPEDHTTFERILWNAEKTFAGHPERCQL